MTTSEPIIKSIFTFERDGKPVAELHLDLRSENSVKGWHWEGDPSMKKIIAPLPKDDQQLWTRWHCRIRRAAEKAGINFTIRGEGGEHLLMPRPHAPWPD